MIPMCRQALNLFTSLQLSQKPEAVEMTVWTFGPHIGGLFMRGCTAVMILVFSIMQTRTPFFVLHFPQKDVNTKTMLQ